MKKLFTAIQHNDMETVRNLPDKDPVLISCTRKGPPKKYDGQSPLQVALKASNTEMIELLLTYQPNVNFIEEETCKNPWRAPVIHDAIERAILRSRWNLRRPEGLEVFNDETTAEEAFALQKNGSLWEQTLTPRIPLEMLALTERAYRLVRSFRSKEAPTV